jgi:hypothetical protein
MLPKDCETNGEMEFEVELEEYNEKCGVFGAYVSVVVCSICVCGSSSA